MNHRFWIVIARGLLGAVLGVVAWGPDRSIGLNVQAQASGSVRLTHSLGPNETILDYLISPDSQTVVYRTGNSVSPQTAPTAVYVAPVAGGQPVALSAPQPANLQDIRFAAGQTLVYVVRDTSPAQVDQLYRASSLGGTPAPVLPASAVRRGIHEYALTPDGTQVVVMIDSSSPSTATYNLYSIPVSGGTPRLLNNPVSTNGSVWQGWVISPIGPRVVFAATQQSGGQTELFSRLVDGSDPAPVRLNSALPDGYSVRPHSRDNPFFPSAIYPALRLTADGQRVTFLVDSPLPQCCGPTTATTQLFVAPIDASGAARRLNRDGQTVPHGPWTTLISPDGERVVYTVQRGSSAAQTDLATVALDGTTGSDSILVNLGPSSEGIRFLSFAAGDQLVYGVSTDPAVAGAATTLYALTLNDGSEPRRLTRAGEILARFSLDGDRSHLYYVSEPRSMLFAVPITGDDTDRALLAPPGTTDFSLGPAPNEHVVFRGGGTDFALYGTSLNTPVMAGQRLGIGRGTGWQSGDFMLSPDGSRVVFRALEPLTFMPILASVDLNQPVTTDTGFRRFTGVVFPGRSPSNYRLSADGRYAVFATYTGHGSTGREVYSVRLPDGIPVPLSFTSEQSLPAVGFAVSPDSSHVILNLEIATLGGPSARNEIWSVPISGGTWTPLTPMMGDDQRISSYGVVGDLAYYTTSRNSPSSTDLFVVPIDGSQPPRQLSADLPIGASITAVTPSPDGRRLAYVVNRGFPALDELHSVVVAGALEPAIRLSPPLEQGFVIDTWDFSTGRPALRWSPDSRYLVYATYQTVGQRRDVFSVPADGPASAAQQLNDPQATGSEPAGVNLTFSTDGQHVVFTQAATTTQPSLVWSVPISGSHSVAIQVGANPVGNRGTGFPITAGPGEIAYEVTGAGPGVTSVLYVGPDRGPATAMRAVYAGPVFRFRHAAGCLVVATKQGGSLWPDALYCAPTDGSGQARLLTPNLGQSIVLVWGTSPDGRWLAYVSEAGLAATPIGPTDMNPLLLAQNTTTGVRLREYPLQFTPDNRRVIFALTDKTIGEFAISEGLPALLNSHPLFLPVLTKS